MTVTGMGRLFKSEAAVATRLRTRLIEIDEDLGMPKCPHPAVADGLATMHKSHRLPADHFHRALRLRLELQSGLLKTRFPVRILAWSLAGRPCLWVVGRLDRE